MVTAPKAEAPLSRDGYRVTPGDDLPVEGQAATTDPTLDSKLELPRKEADESRHQDRGCNKERFHEAFSDWRSLVFSVSIIAYNAIIVNYISQPTGYTYFMALLAAFSSFKRNLIIFVISGTGNALL